MLVKIFIKWLCYVNGYQVRPIRSEAQIIEFYQMRNRVYQKMYQISATRIPQQLDCPKGQTHWFGIYHGSQLVGTAKLLDLAHHTSSAELIYSNDNFDYSPEDTYGFESLVIDREHQGSSRSLFYILMAITHWYTIETGKTRWIVSAHKKLYQRLLNMGLTLEFISDDVQFKDDNSHSAQFLRNYFQNEELKNCCCFYAYQPRNLPMMQLKKFLLYQIRRATW